MNGSCEKNSRTSVSTMQCVFSVGKMADLMYGHQGREPSISATEQFQRKRHKVFDVRCTLSTWQRFHDKRG